MSVDEKAKQGEERYWKGSPINEISPAGRERRLNELKSTLKDYVRIDDERLDQFYGKRDTKNKRRTADSFKFHRDLLAFLEMVRL